MIVQLLNSLFKFEDANFVNGFDELIIQQLLDGFHGAYTIFISDECRYGKFLLLVGCVDNERRIDILHRQDSPIDTYFCKIFCACVNDAQISSVSSSEAHIGCEHVTGKLLFCKLHFLERWVAINEGARVGIEFCFDITFR